MSATEAAKIAALLTEAEKRAIRSAGLMVSGRYRMSYTTPKQVWKALWRDGLAEHGSPYLNAKGLAVRTALTGASDNA